jgi:glycosyltransferase involved in cell wall biosynthesis
LKISIITAVFNRHETVQEALESVARQTHGDVEHVVVDGASNDGTLEVLERLRNQIEVLVSEKDAGIYDALNKGIGLASGEVVGFLHADDLFADDRVISRIAAAFTDTSVDAVYGDLVYVSKNDTNRVIRYWRAGTFSRRRLSWGWMPPHPTFYVRRSVYQRLGAFDTRHRIAADYDCMLRFLGRGGIVPKYIPEVLVKMRVGGASNRSIANILRKSREDYRALRNNSIGGLGALAWKNLSKLQQFLR